MTLSDMLSIKPMRTSLTSALTTLVLCPLLFITLTLTSCSSNKPDEPKELEDSNKKDAGQEISLDTPEAELLENGKKYFNQNLYSLARQNFEAIKAGYPLSSYIEFAEIKIADCLFETGEYADSAKAYEDFVKSRPASEAAPYMLFRAARSFQLSSKGIGKDSAPLEKSLELYNRLLTDFSESPFIESGKKYRSQVVEDLAANDKRIEHFYEKQNRTAAVEARQKQYEEKWTPSLKETAYKEASTEAPPVGKAVSAIPAEASSPLHTSQVSTLPQQGRILKIDCSAGAARGVFVYFDRDLPLLAAYKTSQRIFPQNGMITLKLIGVIAPQQTSTCFDKEDLSLSSDGTLRLRSGNAGSALSLINPPRLFISVPEN